MTRRAHLSDRVVDVAATADPVAAVLAAHERGDLLALRTSGTSGGPRAVVRTASSWFGSFPHVTDLMGLATGSRVWLPGPLGATMNLFAAVHATSVGAEVVDRPGHATHAVLTPAVLARALSSAMPVRGLHLVVAGDRLGRDLHEAALRAGAERVSHYYGAAELSFVAWGPHADGLRPFPEVEVDCADGRVWARSPFLFVRYDGPDGPLVRRGDGFVTVGDRGRLEDGHLRVLGRGTDTVVTAGATVLVADVEAALEAATGTRPVVVGLPHPDLGQVLCAVVPGDDAVPSLRDAARAVLDPAQRPRRWAVMAAPPLSAAGKVDRQALRELLLRRHGTRGGRRPAGAS